MAKADPKKKRVTIRDVAAEVGVDRSTVSLALRHDKRIPLKRRQEIQAAAKKLNYVTNHFARSLAGGGTRILGIMVQSMDNLFFAPYLEEFYAIAEQRDYALAVQISFWNTERERNILEHFCQTRMEGVIWSSAEQNRPDIKVSLEILEKHSIPNVMLHGGADCIKYANSTVGTDNGASLHLGLRYLYDLGHRRIAVVSVADTKTRRGIQHNAMLNTVRKGMQDLGLVFDPALCFCLSENAYGGVKVAGALAAMAPMQRPTAVFALDDQLARALVSGLELIGMPPPNPISVLGFDNAPGAELGTIPITTVSLEQRKCAREAIETLFTTIDDPAFEPVHKRIPTRIIERASCSRLDASLSV